MAARHLVNLGELRYAVSYLAFPLFYQHNPLFGLHEPLHSLNFMFVLSFLFTHLSNCCRPNFRGFLQPERMSRLTLRQASRRVVADMVVKVLSLPCLLVCALA